MKHQTQHVGRYFAIVQRTPVKKLREKLLCSGVAVDDIPAAIHCDRRERFLLIQNCLQCRTYWKELRIIKTGLAKHRRESRRQQECIPLPQRNRQRLGNVQHHIPAWFGPAGLHETHVTRRDICFNRQCELAEVACLAPVLKELAKWRCGRGR